MALRLTAAIGALCVCHMVVAQWRDPSPHGVRFVTIDEGVRLELLDWGGKGRSVVLLEGLGNTARVFDEFTAKISGPNMYTASLAEDMGPRADLCMPQPSRFGIVLYHTRLHHPFE